MMAARAAKLPKQQRPQARSASSSRTASQPSFVSSASKIVCIGRNYAEHAKELGNAVPTNPVLFLKPTSSFITEPQSILIPDGVTLHHEVELGVVIGQRATRVAAADALRYVSGYTLALDMTARNLQDAAKKAGLPWTMAKGQDTWCPVGGFLPAARVPDPSKLQLWLKIDGAEKQRGRTSDMLFSVQQQLQEITAGMTLYPGDLVLTGTPSGVGPVRPGQVITAGLDDADGSPLLRISFPVAARPSSKL
jgi:acylpyruvate hydrolase